MKFLFPFLLLIVTACGTPSRTTLPPEGRISTIGIDAPLSRENIYDFCHHLTAPVEMQQFDMDAKGNIYYAYVGPQKAYYKVMVSKVRPSREPSKGVESSMTIYYAGHPTSMDVEDGKDGKTYIWIPEYSRKLIDPEDGPLGQYWGCQTFARIPYVPGGSFFPWNKEVEHFFVGNEGDINLSVDWKHNVLCVTYHNYEIKNYTRRIVAYSLKEALALPLTDCVLPHPITYGGDGAPHESERTDTMHIMAHDLRKLTPLAEFGIPTDRRYDINKWSWQGFECYDGLVFFVEGDSHKGMGNSRAALTIFDLTGQIVERRTVFGFVENASQLKALDITENGKIEVEGVKVWKGDLYVGFASGGYHGEKEFRCNVFKYKLPKKK